MTGGGARLALRRGYTRSKPVFGPEENTGGIVYRRLLSVLASLLHQEISRTMGLPRLAARFNREPLFSTTR